jgi:hypothetical protein
MFVVIYYFVTIGSEYGFLMPPSYILPVGQEWWQALLNVSARKREI